MCSPQAAEFLVRIANEKKNAYTINSKILYIAERVLVDPRALDALEPIRDAIKAIVIPAAVKPNEAAFKLQELQSALGEAALVRFHKSASPNLSFRSEKGRKLLFDEAFTLGISEERAIVVIESSIAADARSEAADAEILAAESAKVAMARDQIKADIAKGAASPSNSGMVAECTKCKYTLFVAPGREGKFFGPNFVCPECGAPKDDFKVTNGPMP
jgi:rubrerythrin